ncbi:hypothetical protein BGZ49_001786 [Haplosporangium sp. Z 27]|nr:hypothetical protein BGZ49_001786 [Haplosporangium sp. Z 27]
MVRQRSNSRTIYRVTQSIPETPLTPRTPRTPRSPHMHRSRLLSPTNSRTRASLKREHEDIDLDLDLDLVDAPRNLRSLPNANANPTPSEILSMDLNTLALHSNNSRLTATPSARLSDEGIEHLNLSLPFERLRSPSKSLPSNTLSPSKVSPHRYPTRTLPHESGQSPQTTPVKNRSTISNRIATPPSSQRSALISPPHSNARQFMTDEANNLFLAQSPRAIRTPRRIATLADQPGISPSPVKPPRAPDMASLLQQTDDAPAGPCNLLDHVIYPDLGEDDAIETESVQSSTGDFEKENRTPKSPDESTNPFYVGGTKRHTRSSVSKTDGSTTPTGSSTPAGTITRSKRLALGSISPWRWNTFDEQFAFSSQSNTKGSKNLGCMDNSSSKSDNSVSEWVDSVVSSERGSASSGNPASSSSAQKSRQTPGGKTSSSTSLIGPPLGGKNSTAKLPEHHPNSVESAERKGGPSSVVAKLTATVIQPHSIAFNRRAQQLAGQIYYWKHGSYHLVSEHDKQQWPGEWKFEVFQDPESPGSSSKAETSSSNSTTAAYSGKGKLTDRQLRGPVSKRSRIHRESYNGTLEHTNNCNGEVGDGNNININFQSNDAGLSQLSGVHDEPDIALPPSPSHRASRMRQNAALSAKQSHLDARYNFRERRMLNEPLTSRSRRCGA